MKPIPKDLQTQIQDIERVSVYVPVYNAERYIEKCLTGIKAQTYPIEDTIVIDDGSTDRSMDIARDMGVRVISQPGNLGLSLARRRAFDEIETPLIAALDADCVPEPNWLGTLIPDMKNPAVAGTSGKLLEFQTDTHVDRWRKVHMVQHWGDRRLNSPLHLFGNNTLFRKDAICDAGNYPTGSEYKTNNEDYYISRRLRERGYQIIYNPQALVYHHRRDDRESLFRTYWNWFFLHRSLPNSPGGIWKKAKDNCHWTVEFLKRDIKTADWRLAALDLDFFYEQCLLDLRYFLKQRRGIR